MKKIIILLTLIWSQLGLIQLCGAEGVWPLNPDELAAIKETNDKNPKPSVPKDFAFQASPLEDIRVDYSSNGNVNITQKNEWTFSIERQAGRQIEVASHHPQYPKFDNTIAVSYTRETWPGGKLWEMAYQPLEEVSVPQAVVFPEGGGALVSNRYHYVPAGTTDVFRRETVQAERRQLHGDVSIEKKTGNVPKVYMDPEGTITLVQKETTSTRKVIEVKRTYWKYGSGVVVEERQGVKTYYQQTDAGVREITRAEADALAQRFGGVETKTSVNAMQVVYAGSAGSGRSISVERSGAGQGNLQVEILANQDIRLNGEPAGNLAATPMVTLQETDNGGAVIVSQGLISLRESYCDDQGDVYTRTLTFMEDNKVVEHRAEGGRSSIQVHYLDASGRIQCTAKLEPENGRVTFFDARGAQTGTAALEESGGILLFDHPLGQGEEHVAVSGQTGRAVEIPASATSLAEIQYLAFGQQDSRSGMMCDRISLAFPDEDGGKKEIIILAEQGGGSFYLQSDNYAKAYFKNIEPDMGGAYSGPDGKEVLVKNEGVIFVERYLDTDGQLAVHSYAFQGGGKGERVLETTQTGGHTAYTVHFLDTTTGDIKYSASLDLENRQAVFATPAGQVQGSTSLQASTDGTGLLQCEFANLMSGAKTQVTAVFGSEGTQLATGATNSGLSAVLETVAVPALGVSLAGQKNPDGSQQVLVVSGNGAVLDTININPAQGADGTVLTLATGQTVQVTFDPAGGVQSADVISSSSDNFDIPTAASEMNYFDSNRIQQTQQQRSVF